MELILYDQLKNLRDDFERMSLVRQGVTHKEVAQSYFGLQSVDRTMTMTAFLATRLSLPVLSEIGKIMNSEYPELYTNNLASSNKTTPQEALRIQDCRKFRSFLKLNSLYASSAFMNHNHKDHPDGTEPQINASVSYTHLTLPTTSRV